MTKFLQFASDKLSAFWSQNSGEFISALAGALAGALAAYWIQSSTERRKERKARRSAIIRAQMALISQLNILAGFRQQKLDPFRSEKDRELRMTIVHLPRNCLPVDFESITFLLESNDANLLLKIQVAERAYHSAMDAVDVRNRSIQDLRARSELQSGDHESGEFIVRADPRDIKLVKDFTDALYSSTDHAERLCADAIADLKAAGKKIFSKGKFLSATIPSNKEAT